MEESDKNVEPINRRFAEFIVEEYRFLKSYVSLLNKAMSDEKQKYKGLLDFHVNRLQDFMKECNLKIVDIEGKKYDEGLSITPLNIEDFG